MASPLFVPKLVYVTKRQEFLSRRPKINEVWVAAGPHHPDKVAGSAPLPQVSQVDAGVQIPGPPRPSTHKTLLTKHAVGQTVGDGVHWLQSRCREPSADMTTGPCC